MHFAHCAHIPVLCYLEHSNTNIKEYFADKASISFIKYLHVIGIKHCLEKLKYVLSTNLIEKECISKNIKL